MNWIIRVLGIFFVLLVATDVCADDPKADAVKKELENLQGDWEWAATNFGGKVSSKKGAIYYARFTFKGDKLVKELVAAGRRDPIPIPGTVAIDPTKDRKWIDFTYDKPHVDAGQKELGIYAVSKDGATLWISFGKLGSDERPKKLNPSFVETVDSIRFDPEFVDIYKKVK